MPNISEQYRGGTHVDESLLVQSVDHIKDTLKYELQSGFKRFF